MSGKPLVTSGLIWDNLAMLNMISESETLRELDAIIHAKMIPYDADYISLYTRYEHD